MFIDILVPYRGVLSRTFLLFSAPLNEIELHPSGFVSSYDGGACYKFECRVRTAQLFRSCVFRIKASRTKQIDSLQLSRGTDSDAVRFRREINSRLLCYSTGAAVKTDWVFAGPGITLLCTITAAGIHNFDKKKNT